MSALCHGRKEMQVGTSQQTGQDVSQDQRLMQAPEQQGETACQNQNQG
jgi:hypothetical protein